LLFDRFAADIGKALSGAEAVSEELQRRGAELVVLLERPASMAVGPEAAP
jgi:hypothetical protein